MTTRTLLALAITIACSVGIAQAQAPVADFFSTTSLLDGQQLPAGTTIEAYDSDEVRCGYAEANSEVLRSLDLFATRVMPRFA